MRDTKSHKFFSWSCFSLLWQYFVCQTSGNALNCILISNAPNGFLKHLSCHNKSVTDADDLWPQTTGLPTRCFSSEKPGVNGKKQHGSTPPSSYFFKPYKTESTTASILSELSPLRENLNYVFHNRTTKATSFFQIPLIISKRRVARATESNGNF